MRVAELSARDIDELFGLRDVLERYAVQTALEPAAPARPGCAGPADRPRSTTCERAPTAGGALAQASAHREFHLALVALAGHQHLMRAYEPVLLQLQLYMATNMRREAEVRSAGRGRAAGTGGSVTRWSAGDTERVLAELERHGARAYLAPELNQPVSVAPRENPAQHSRAAHAVIQP